MAYGLSHFIAKHLDSIVVMSVIGVDFGNQSLLIGQAGKGGVDVILNESSNRQTATYVSVSGKQRFIGDSGAAMVRNFPISNCIDFFLLLTNSIIDCTGALKHKKHGGFHETFSR